MREDLQRSIQELTALGIGLGRTGILAVSPVDIADHPSICSAKAENVGRAKSLAENTSARIKGFLNGTEDLFAQWDGEGIKELAVEARETIRNYQMYLEEFAWGCERLFAPSGVGVSYISEALPPSTDASLVTETIGLAEPLQELLWSERPFACMSATLALDGDFEFFKRTTGAEADFEEILPSPFDFKRQCALVLPPIGTIGDPSAARRDGLEDEYYAQLAETLSKTIVAAGGRTLALFHSRKEMEGVFAKIDLGDEFAIYIQRKSGAFAVGERFRKNTKASLFALRSFWTGFDAPGETLSCVVLVRVPFEVPVDPPSIGRQAWMQSQGLDPFVHHTLPVAKMLMRQGAGRLIRRIDDKGVIAILDPRVRTKRYGEEILRNLPEMRIYTEANEAFAAVGLAD
jgi:ATP-dependent DNA helicase DinG